MPHPWHRSALSLNVRRGARRSEQAHTDAQCQAGEGWARTHARKYAGGHSNSPACPSPNPAVSLVADEGRGIELHEARRRRDEHRTLSLVVLDGAGRPVLAGNAGRLEGRGNLLHRLELLALQGAGGGSKLMLHTLISPPRLHVAAQTPRTTVAPLAFTSLSTLAVLVHSSVSSCVVLKQQRETCRTKRLQREELWLSRCACGRARRGCRDVCPDVEILPRAVGRRVGYLHEAGALA